MSKALDPSQILKLLLTFDLLVDGDQRKGDFLCKSNM